MSVDCLSRHPLVLRFTLMLYWARNFRKRLFTFNSSLWMVFSLSTSGGYVRVLCIRLLRTYKQRSWTSQVTLGRYNQACLTLIMTTISLFLVHVTVINFNVVVMLAITNGRLLHSMQRWDRTGHRNCHQQNFCGKLLWWCDVSNNEWKISTLNT